MLDEDSFVELDALAKHRSTNFNLGEKRPLGDIFSQDATVFGGSLGEVYGEKIVKVQELQRSRPAVRSSASTTVLARKP